MAATNRNLHADSASQEHPYQGIYDAVQSHGHRNEIAQRYHAGSRLTTLSGPASCRAAPATGGDTTAGHIRPPTEVTAVGHIRPPTEVK